MYHNLGCPNLALLQLDMVGRPEDALKFSREYSFLSAKWKPFASTQDKLSWTIQMRHLDLWQSASEIERFAMVVEEWWDQPPLSRQSQPQSPNGPEAHFSAERPSESFQQIRNGSEELENEEIFPPLTPTSDPTEARARINARVQGATTTPNPHMGTVDETDEIDDILAAAALQSMQHPMTIPDASQNSFARSATESAGGWQTLGDVSQGNQITLESESESGEINGLSHAMDLPNTGGFDSMWIPGHGDQAQSQPENNLRRRYVPDPSSDEMEPPHKHSRLDHRINPDAAVPTPNCVDQAAIIDILTSIAGQGQLHSSQGQVMAPSANTTSVPTTMMSLQQNDAIEEDTRQDVNAYDDWAWDSIRDPNFWTEFEFALTPAGHTDLWGSGPSQPINNDPLSFPTY